VNPSEEKESVAEIAMRFRISLPKLGVLRTLLILAVVADCVVIGWKLVERAKLQSAVVSKVSRTHGTSQSV
jgi:hypothetical protein